MLLAMCFWRKTLWVFGNQLHFVLSKFDLCLEFPVDWKRAAVRHWGRHSTVTCHTLPKQNKLTNSTLVWKNNYCLPQTCPIVFLLSLYPIWKPPSRPIRWSHTCATSISPIKFGKRTPSCSSPCDELAVSPPCHCLLCSSLYPRPRQGPYQNWKLSKFTLTPTTAEKLHVFDF